ncbi:hypothetical protein F7R91_40835 [Streptomyces luteolifulvus]|uniref:Uncharacterized protein n=1 Tax=Streptomyces luteolifulvus TaxID=2615112 RepID=A0A6H9UNJ8_9ACTN|nr:hypothetical protein F7R91_40835 [Streptomyces luteolifulvus]
MEVRPGQTPAHSQPLIPNTTTRDTIRPAEPIPAHHAARISFPLTPLSRSARHPDHYKSTHPGEPWLLEQGLRRDAPPLYVHVSGCHMAGERSNVRRTGRRAAGAGLGRTGSGVRGVAFPRWPRLAARRRPVDDSAANGHLTGGVMAFWSMLAHCAPLAHAWRDFVRPQGFRAPIGLSAPATGAKTRSVGARTAVRSLCGG